MIKEEDYIIPPSYEESEYKVSNDNPLISRLYHRIAMDLKQISNVYDDQIEQLQKRKQKEIEKLENEYKKKSDNIMKQKNSDIEKYTSQAEKRIDELILSINNPIRKKSVSFLEWLGVI